MPELPEVEAARRAIEEHCIGKKIRKVIVADDEIVINGASPADFEAALVGKTLISALRKGKILWLQLDSPPFPSFHFGMAGAVYIKGVAVTKYKRSAVKDTEEWPSKYSKVFIELDDGLEFSFTDKRRLAKVRLLEDPASVPPISELGPDALLEPMSVDELHELLSRKKMAIKALLLEQSFISGIGNWVADEVLYQARIHPLQNASTLSKESCTTLLKCIEEVIQYAVQVDAECSHFPFDWLFHFRWGKKPGKVNGKRSLMRLIIFNRAILSQVIEKALEVGADSSQFPKNWIFHSREKKSGKAFVDGKKIDFITVGGRTAAYVPELQKLVGNQTTKVKDKSKQEKDGVRDEVGATEELGAAKPSKSKKEMKPRGRGKNPPTKRKSTSSDDDNEDDKEDGADEDGAPEDEKVERPKSKREVKPRSRGKKPPAQKKSNSRDGDNEDDNNEDASNDEIDDGQTRQQGRVNNNKRAKMAEKASKKAAFNRNARSPKKKVK